MDFPQDKGDSDMAAVTPVSSAVPQPAHQVHSQNAAPRSKQPSRPVNPIQIDQLSAQGLSSFQIAQRLGISQSAVTKDDGDADDSASTTPRTNGQTVGTVVNKTA